MVSVSVREQTEPASAEPADVEKVVHVYPFTQWSPPLVDWIRLGDDPDSPREPATSSFEVQTLDLPLASDRWLIKWPGHPNLTLEDLRAGRVPRATPDELAERQKAIEAAHDIRKNLNIAPLTTEAIIRRLRHGHETE